MYLFVLQQKTAIFGFPILSRNKCTEKIRIRLEILMLKNNIQPCFSFSLIKLKVFKVVSKLICGQNGMHYNI